MRARACWKCWGKSETPEVMGSAVLVLGRMGKRAQDELRDILSPKASSPVQTNVLRGLGMIGAGGAWLAPEVLALAEHGLDGLARRLKDGKPGDSVLEGRRSDALLTLGYIGADSKKSAKLLEQFFAQPVVGPKPTVR